MATAGMRIRHGLRNILLKAGCCVTKKTQTPELLELIKKLRPVDYGIPLIRLGGEADGGYLLPDDLESIEYCFSPGVSTVADFETHLANLNIKSFLADYSVDRPPIERPEFTFDKKFLGSEESEKFITLKSWKEKYLSDYQGDLLLQMDIEGAEYDVIRSTPIELLGAFRIMVIEFHFLDRLFDQFAFDMVLKPCFEKVLSKFYVAHIHPNNVDITVKDGDIEIPRLLEITFHNRDRVSELVAKKRSFPHVLDRDNVPSNPSLALPQIWHASNWTFQDNS